MTTTPEGNRVLARSLTVAIDVAGSDCSRSQRRAPLYAGPLSKATIPGPSDELILGAGSEQLLCFRVTFPLEGSDALQASRATATFVFHAERIVH
jgi:hypothetical protein